MPCKLCKLSPNSSGIGYRSTWPYYHNIQNDPPGSEWTETIFPEIPLDKWNFSFAPDLPAGVPVLFLYSESEPGADLRFYSDDFLTYLDGRKDGSAHFAVEGSDHWVQVRKPEFVNQKIVDFIIATSDSLAGSSAPCALTSWALLCSVFASLSI